MPATRYFWSGTPEIVRNYIVPDHNFFGFFPWASFVAFGMSAGPVMGKIVAALVAGRKAGIDIAPFSPARFGA